MGRFGRGSWSHVDVRVEASCAAAGLDGLWPAQTPRDLVSASIGWRTGCAVISTTLRHGARQFDDDQNTRPLAPATALDGYLALPLTRAVVIELRGENLLYKRVGAGISGTDNVERATRRTLWPGLRLRG